MPVAQSELPRRVVEQHDFDLAYWRHDFDDPAYWLEPLFDQAPQAHRPGGPSFMGYTQDKVIALSPMVIMAVGRMNSARQCYTHSITESR